MRIAGFFSAVIIVSLLTLTTPWAQETPSEASASPGSLAVETADASYRIGPGDILDISVWKDDALTKLIPVLPDGTLSFPLVGKLTAGGRTLEEFKSELEARIRRYVPDPVLSVSIHQVNSMMVYVIGRVNNPGRVMLNTKITALQALAMAGGPNPFAKRNGIKIFRKDSDRTLIFDFPYEDISHGEHLESNIEMQRGDVMVVP
jgi:polysaccharide export outer membrane protein